MKTPSGGFVRTVYIKRNDIVGVHNLIADSYEEFGFHLSSSRFRIKGNIHSRCVTGEVDFRSDPWVRQFMCRALPVRRPLFAEGDGIVPTMVNAAAKAKISVHPIRRNISVLEGSWP